jgi:hypothetical protein
MGVPEAASPLIFFSVSLIRIKFASRCLRFD